MSATPATETGTLLWRLLPLIYRRWDGTHGKDPARPTKTPAEPGDLAGFLDAHGLLFDLIRGTLEQRLRDISPVTCQPWLIPYFADLLDVHLVSPDIDGQREEVARAVSWRQRKGTIGCAAEIAREVGRFERTVLAPDTDDQGRAYSDTFPTIHIQEGFRRVLATARVDVPLPGLRALGLDPLAQKSQSPIDAARRPGLPGGTVDFRWLSRAREIDADTPVSHIHAFGSDGVRWQQENPTGAPCYVDTYQDVSVRTVDVRRPNWARGHYHPRRVLAYSAPRDGFFPPGQFTVPWTKLTGWFGSFRTDDTVFTERADEFGNRVQERVLAPVDFLGDDIILIERIRSSLDGRTTRSMIVGRRRGAGDPPRDYRVERIDGIDYVLVTGFELINTDQGAVLRLTGFGEKPPRISATAPIALDTLDSATAYVLDGVVVDGHLAVVDTVLTVRRAAIRQLTASFPEGTASGPLPENPDLGIVDSLIGNLEVTGGGLCRLEYVTVLSGGPWGNLEASDCIILGAPQPDFSALYLRYCCVPWAPTERPEGAVGQLYGPTITRVSPMFLNDSFGDPGCGVLHPGAARAIRAGAEDGGELGGYHHRHFVLREEAVIDKLRDFLPVSQEPVLIPHDRWVRPIVPLPDPPTPTEA